jgi:hypothetical protein
MKYEVNEQNFLKDVAEHRMIVIRDDGVNRHIRFAKPGTSCMHFDLITWPGYLCYTGDMGTYVFTRIEDMFEFFRRGDKRFGIDRRYWAEKCVSIDRDGIEEFDEERFNSQIIGMLIEWLRENRHKTSKEERRDLWEAVMSEVLDADSDSGGYRKKCAAHDFSHEINEEIGAFYFRDLFERSFTNYTVRFTWCCFALAWGIEQYDKTKVVEAVPA